MSSNKEIKFSIITPTFNRAIFLPSLAEKIAAQTYLNFEWIIVDDGSTDDTPTIVKQLQSKFNFIKSIRSINRERGAARNTGVQHATGAYVTFLDSDDIIYANHLSSALQYTTQSAIWFWLPYETIQTNGFKLKPAYIPTIDPAQALLKGNFLSCHGVFIQREVALVNPFIEDRNLSGSEDYVCWLQLIARFPLIIGNQVTNALVQHTGRSVLGYSAQAIFNRMEAIRKYIYQDDIFVARFGKPCTEVESYLFLYTALHLALIGKKQSAFENLIISIDYQANTIFRKTFWATLKHLWLKY